MEVIGRYRNLIKQLRKLDKQIEVGSFLKSTRLHYNHEGILIFAKTAGVLGSARLGKPYVYDGGRFNYTPEFYIKDVKSVELFVDSIPVSIFKRAFTGALLFGGVGAVAGALSTINVKPKSKITVIVYFDSIELSSISISCKDIGEASRIISTMANLESHVNEIKNIDGNYSEPVKEKYVSSQYSLTDEIMKLKKMLDDGTINQEEFEIFKNKLMK